MKLKEEMCMIDLSRVISKLQELIACSILVNACSLISLCAVLFSDHPELRTARSVYGLFIFHVDICIHTAALSVAFPESHKNKPYRD